LAESIPLLAFLGAMELRQNDHDGMPESKRLYVDKVLEILQEGDIVLMKTEGLLQGLTRAFTHGAYDHCGIVVPSPVEEGGNEWALLEATVEGVHFYGLRRRLLSWDLSHAKVVVRRLMFGRSAQTRAVLRDFCLEVDGKPYGLSPIKIFRRNSTDSKESYFCSELVARAYQQLQLLPADVACCDFLPVSFSQSNRLQLLQGAYLDDEILVEFKKNEVSESQARTTRQYNQLIAWLQSPRATTTSKVSSVSSSSSSSRAL